MLINRFSAPYNRRPHLWQVPAIILLLIGLVVFANTMAPTAAQAVSAAPGAELNALLAKAEKQGSVRVIVGLDIAFAPEGKLAHPQAIETQQQAIQIAQSRVWQQLTGSSSQLIANFKYIPYMAVAVDAVSLNKLAGLPEVTQITEDRLAAPALTSSIPRHRRRQSLGRWKHRGRAGDRHSRHRRR